MDEEIFEIHSILEIVDDTSSVIDETEYMNGNDTEEFITPDFKSDDTTSQPPSKRKKVLKQITTDSENTIENHTSSSSSSNVDSLNISVHSTSKEATSKGKVQGSIESTKLYRKSLFDGTFYNLESVKSKDFDDKKCLISAECKLCNTIIRGDSNSTGNFRRHIRLKHADRYDEFIEEKSNESRRRILLEKQRRSKACINLSKDSRTSLPSKKQKLNQKQFDALLVKFILSNLHTLGVLEEPAFKELLLATFQSAGTSLQIMSRRMLMRKIEQYSDQIETKVGELFQKIKYVCTTTDIWSTHSKSFLAVTAHWIDSESQNPSLDSLTLTCEQIKTTQDLETIRDIIERVHLKFGIQNKVIANVTENGSDFVKYFAINDAVINLRDFYEYDDEPEEVIFQKIDLENLYQDSLDPIDSADQNLPLRCHCAANALNALVFTDFNFIISHHPSFQTDWCNLISKCSIIWKCAQQLETKELIERCIKRKLPFLIPSKSSTWFDCLSVIQEKLAAFVKVGAKLDLAVEFSWSEIKFLEAYLTCLKPIIRGVDQLNKNPCLGFLLPVLYGIEEQLVKLKSNDNDTIKTLSEELHTEFCKRFHCYISLDFTDKRVRHAVFATFSLPQFKVKWIKNGTHKENVNRIVEKELSIIHRARSRSGRKNGTQEGKEHSVQVKIEKCDDDASSPIKNFLSRRESEVSTLINREIVNYVTNKSSSLAMLSKYSCIKEMYLKYNCILCSPVPVAKLISFSSDLDVPKRNHLSDDVYRKILFVHSNKNIL